MKRVLEKTIIVLCLLIAIYITITCECNEILLSCKKYLFYILVGIPFFYILITTSFIQ
jgi:hypothetical protein